MAGGGPKPELPIVAFESRRAWERWLAKEHARSDGVRLKLAKKGTGIASVSFAEALEVALCHGWIDSQGSRFDESYYLQRFTPRRRRSKWSQINRDKVTTLIEAGKMKPPGLAEVERAKADGRWDAAYAPQSQATIPDDLARELERNERAREFFATLDSQNRYAILHRIHDAKRPETRARRIREYVAMLAEGRKLHP
jgi:uncharacterized protein YdeI (YjbR/CyaY-like superfamily)